MKRSDYLANFQRGRRDANRSPLRNGDLPTEQRERILTGLVEERDKHQASARIFRFERDVQQVAYLNGFLSRFESEKRS
jgi:hypothetical protein